jgi:hypothetical protein
MKAYDHNYAPASDSSMSGWAKTSFIAIYQLFTDSAIAFVDAGQRYDIGCGFGLKFNSKSSMLRRLVRYLLNIWPT